jgi:hypothetical protein
LIFALKSSFGFPSKKQIKGKVSVLSFSKASLVMVLQLFKVKLTDGFAEFDCPFQYFTKAILLGSRGTRHFYVMRISSRDKIVCCKHEI